VEDNDDSRVILYGSVIEHQTKNLQFGKQERAGIGDYLVPYPVPFPPSKKDQRAREDNDNSRYPGFDARLSNIRRRIANDKRTAPRIQNRNLSASQVFKQ
jgi:hypothetical protein